VPFETERREDADLFKGETKTLQAGKAGVVRRTVEKVYADGGLEKSTVLSSTTVSAPGEARARRRHQGPAGPPRRPAAPAAAPAAPTA
jgi:uncharacterized protein YabE (DUF348 family)